MHLKTCKTLTFFAPTVKCFRRLTQTRPEEGAFDCNNKVSHEKMNFFMAVPKDFSFLLQMKSTKADFCSLPAL